MKKERELPRAGYAAAKRDGSVMKAVMQSTRTWDVAILLLALAACSVPFLRQPFHMDDGFYLEMARNAQVRPLFPNDVPYSLQGEHAADMGSHSHPPLQTYFLAAIEHFWGDGPGREWIYHLFSLSYAVLALLFFYFLCARFLERPILPSIVLACSPLFMLMQHSLMTDIPNLAFWLAAICSFVYAADTKSTRLYSASSLFQTAAVFTSYQSFALIPLLGFYQFRKDRSGKGWLAFLPAPVLMALWLTMNYFHYHRMVLGATVGYILSRHSLSLNVLGTKLLAILEYQGWLVIFPFFLFFVFAPALRWRALPLVLLGSAFVAQLEVPEYRFLDKAIFVLGLAAGLIVASQMGKSLWNAFGKRLNRLESDSINEQFLGLWYFGVLAYCLLLFTEGSARYILPLVPPFLIRYFRHLETAEAVEYRIPARFLNAALVAGGTFVVSLAWGLSLSHADQEFARIYPRAASDFSRVTDKMQAYCTGEWGLRYYFSHAGVPPLPLDESMVRGGSYLASPKLALPYQFPADLNSIVIPMKTLSYRVNTRLRILDWQTPAGFYSTGWGLIPFSFSEKPLEQIEIFQVNFMVEQLPWAQVETASSIKPWPGYLVLRGRSLLAILAKPETKIRYVWPVYHRVRLELKCGISPDSYKEGSDAAFEFEVRQFAGDGRVLSERRITLRPGINKEDRDWQPVSLELCPTPKGILEFRYASLGNIQEGTGAFAQSIIEPVD
ncbi:MAG: glycosyltransferase family 39 protein [Acidobacteriota bacterium]|jgi:4-amino-4-deoxy-L-arabinose transferase-like glycosyltransferase